MQVQELISKLSPEVLNAIKKITNADPTVAVRLQDIYDRVKQLRQRTPELLRLQYCLTFDPQQASAKNQKERQKIENLGLLQYCLQWEQQTPNPNPSLFSFKALYGFKDLIEHAATQREQFDMISSALEQVHENQQRVREELEYNVKQRLLVIKKRHWDLKAQFIRCIGLLEDFAVQNQTAVINSELMRQLESATQSMQADMTCGGFQTEIDTIRQRMFQVAERAQPSSKSFHKPNETLSSLLDDTDFDVIVDITDKQHDLFEELRKYIDADVKDLDKVKGALQSKSTSSDRANRAFY